MSCLDTGYFQYNSLAKIPVHNGEGYPQPPLDPELKPHDNRAIDNYAWYGHPIRIRLQNVKVDYQNSPRIVERMNNMPLICREVFGVEFDEATDRQRLWCGMLHRAIEDRAYGKIEQGPFFYPCECMKVSEYDDSSQKS